MASTPGSGGEGDLRERSFAELTRRLSEEVRTLVRQELELARAELGEKGRRAGLGAGFFGGAGLLGLGAFAALTAFLILVLGLVLPDWLAALIVAVVYAAVAGLLALRGRRELKSAGRPIPEQTVESVKEDAQWAKSHARSSSR